MAAPFEVSPLFLLSGRRSVKGWYSGTSIDSQDTLSFSVLAGVRSMNEDFPIERVSEAYDRMLSGKGAGGDISLEFFEFGESDFLAIDPSSAASVAATRKIVDFIHYHAGTARQPS